MSLASLVNPRSIALVGASDRPSIGRTLISSLEGVGYTGNVYPINPRYESVLGHPCYPSVEDLPEAPDLVAFCIGGARVTESFETIAKRGAKAAVIYDGGFAEAGHEGESAQRRIADICREANIALCGPNCMGILNPHGGSTSYLQQINNVNRLRGNVGLVSQSGSICIALVNDVRRYGFSLIVSSGNEAVVTLADYIDHLIDDPNTGVIATFVESIRDPERYVAALQKADRAGKPVVVVKVGKNERTRRAILSHTGGLAGEAKVFSALLARHGAIEVDDLDQMSEVLAALQTPVAPEGNRIAIVCGSGGQSELLLDEATAAKFELPPLAAVDRGQIEHAIGKISGDGNPLDAWGSGTYLQNLAASLAILRDSDNNDVIVVASDSADNLAAGSPDRPFNYLKVVSESADLCDKPHYILSTRAGIMSSGLTDALMTSRVKALSGIRQGLGAIDLIGGRRERRYSGRAVAATGGLRIAQFLTDRPGRKTLHEADSKLLLKSHGIRTCRERVVSSVGDAVHAAVEIGYPVVLKLLSDDVPHKSDHGLVKVGLADETALRTEWQGMVDRASALVSEPLVFLVQEMVDGREVFVGVSRDPNFGLFLAFGLGGVDIEVLKDFVIAALPLGKGEAEAMIRSIRDGFLLKEQRGKPGANLEDLASCLYALSDFVCANETDLAEIDLNPLKLSTRGYICVDALVIPKAAAT